MQITKQSNGIAWFNCQGGHWFLIHNGTEVKQKGLVYGQGGSKDTVEYFDTETEMEERIVQLGLEDNTDD